MARLEDGTVPHWGCPTSLKAPLTEPGDVDGFHIFPDPLQYGLVPIQALRKQSTKPCQSWGGAAKQGGRSTGTGGTLQGRIGAEDAAAPICLDPSSQQL